MQKAFLLPLVTSVLFAGSFITGKYTTTDLQPLTTSLLRYLFALIFLVFCLSYGKKTVLTVNRAHLVLLALAGLAGIVAYHFFFFSALRYTTATNTSIINAFSPVVSALAAAFISKEKLHPVNYLGLITGVTGVLLLLTDGHIHRLHDLVLNRGDGLMLLAVCSWACYALLVKKLAQFYSGLTITFYSTLFGVIFLSLLATGENWSDQLQQMSTRSFWSLVYMGIGASGIGYLLYNLSIAGIGVTRTASMVYSLVPFFVAIMSFLLLAEPVTLPMAGSALLIVLSVHLVLRE